ncbi:hypothetical protein ACJMK2_003115 [Sinanodonta woodiana]|uniref:G-protein coupled receptors family 1 profile domain-containing protein n=1 Tax=Sinanodonta woodiana TaxID=1069815 RepID=A0ABD3XXB2_SINWO
MYTLEMRTIPQAHHNVRGTTKSDACTGKYARDGTIDIVSKKANSRTKNIRVSKILLVVTVFFVLSFTPFLSIELVALSDERLIENLDNTSTVLYQLFWRSYAINFVVNPFIYSVMDTKFRMQCKSFLCKRLNE